MFIVTWSEQERPVESVVGVDLLLDELHLLFRGTEPTLVSIELIGIGDSLSVGLGCDLSVLNYVRGDQNPPYYTSVGELDADEVISFRFGGELSEYPVKNCIPVDRAREAVKHFCNTGKLMPDIAWEEV